MNQNDIMAAIEELQDMAFHPSMKKELSAKSNAVAISALEKQIPKPPEHKVHDEYKSLGKNYYCPCGVMFLDWENQPTKYCGNCGQKLKS